MKIESYIDRIKPSDGFVATNVTKDFYLDVMETSFNGYSMDTLTQRNQMRAEERLDLQCYSRMGTVLAALISAGCKEELQPLWEQIMSDCCLEIHSLGASLVNDFSIKEIMFAYKLMKPYVSDELKKRWMSELAQVDPYKHYEKVIRKSEDIEHLHNINVYNMVGEFLRETEGLCDTEQYFAKHWPTQLERFDHNGMYMDPGCPTLYDVTTRCQIQLMLGFGYQGTYAAELDTHLRQAGLSTLYMQSAAFELPYGGRSNQYLFNEALIAANCEYEANRYKREGNMQMAGAFKRSAHLAIQSITRWLNVNPPRHTKNLYPIEMNYGTEYYGFYDKYMITLGAFLAIAYHFANDEIVEFPCPAEIGGYVWKTSKSFHKIFASAGGYSLQIDTKADLAFDATGLGRIHRFNFPTELGLSTPLTEGEGYQLRQEVQRIYGSICTGWVSSKGDRQFLSGLSEGLHHNFMVIEESEHSVVFSIEYEGACFIGCYGLKEVYSLNTNGLTLKVELIEPNVEQIFMMIPIMRTNGREHSAIRVNGQTLTVSVENHQYCVTSNSQISLTDQYYGNRNGEYDLAILSSESQTISAHFKLTEVI